MSEPRLALKIRETRELAGESGLDLQHAPLLVTFELPVWGLSRLGGGFTALAREPGTAVAVVSADPLADARQQSANHPNLHVVAERGLVCALTGGAMLHVYPHSTAELQSFAVALFASAAPDHLRVSLSPYASSGRQEVTFEGLGPGRAPGARELLHAVRERGGTAAFASEACDAVIVDDDPSELEAVRAALACDLPRQGVRVSRPPSGRFLLQPEPAPRAGDRDRLAVLAQEVAMSCDRFVEVRGPGTFAFVTEPVARWKFNPGSGVRALARELFDAPDTVITQLGLHPFKGEGALFFAYEGSETVWEAANKGIPCVTVRDVLEYGMILHAIRRGE